jgi:hypothetical protein
MTDVKHKDISRTDWGIGADGDHAEYDVPQCAPGTPASQCTHTITGTWMPVGPKKHSSDVSTRLIASHAHCHVSSLTDVAFLFETGPPRAQGVAQSLRVADNTHAATGSHLHTSGHVQQ